MSADNDAVTVLSEDECCAEHRALRTEDRGLRHPRLRHRPAGHRSSRRQRSFRSVPFAGLKALLPRQPQIPVRWTGGRDTFATRAEAAKACIEVVRECGAEGSSSPA